MRDRGHWVRKLAAAACIWYGAASAQPARTVAGIQVFAVYEPVYTERDVDILCRVRPDFVCRGWFKWHNTPDWEKYSPLAKACLEQGILIQGGITNAALYPGENGMDEATFRDFAAAGTDGEPYPVGGWYHLSLYNPKVVEYLKQQVRFQIDAGAAGIWYDEIEGIYDWNRTEGYETYACAAFRDWLCHKYCDGQGWALDDPRWQSRFSIDLSKHGGSMRTFDYPLHLRTTLGRDGRPLAADPAQGSPGAWATSPNPLFGEWGYAWNRKAAGTFRFDTVAAIFADILADADAYAAAKYGRTLINTYNHNGTARPGVAFLQPHNGRQPPLYKGRLDGRVSFLPFYESTVSDAADVCPGAPVVFFVDWPGETDRLTALPRSDQIHFFSLYIPEAYAGGGEFAFPLRGYSYVAANQGSLGFLTRMVDFYREHASWLRGSQAWTDQPTGPDQLSLRVRSTAAGTVAHLLNHAFPRRDVWPVPQSDVEVVLPWSDPPPAGAFAVSPDFPEQRPVAATLDAGQLTLSVPRLDCSSLVILPKLDACRRVSGRAATGTHILAVTGRALAVARDETFSIWLSPDVKELECLETGERLAVSPGMAFAAPPAGGMAAGLVLDDAGIPVRHADIASGKRHWHTDMWGRFRIPLALAPDRKCMLAVGTGRQTRLELGEGFRAWQTKPPQRCVGRFSEGLDGYWPNWPNKEHAPGVVTIAREDHLGRPGLRCEFAANPKGAWRNVNSPSFEIQDVTSIEITYAGDGSDRTVSATLFSWRRKRGHLAFSADLPLASREWVTKRIPLSAFRSPGGEPFDTSLRTASLQLAIGDTGDTPAVIWLHEVQLINDFPTRMTWHSDAAFDLVDVDNLRAGHTTLPPPPVVATRRPLLRFATLPDDVFANWDGRNSQAPGSVPLVTATCQAPPDEPAFLHVSFPPGTCAWGNANVPLSPSLLHARDGIAIRLRVAPPTAVMTLSLHVQGSAGTGPGRGFYHTDCEAQGDWTEIVLPWAEFRRGDGPAFSPDGVGSVSLQICRPGHRLAKDIGIDVQSVDAVSFAP